MNDIIMWGIGKISEVISYYIENDSNFNICAYCVDAEYKTIDVFRSLPVVDFNDIENIFPPKKYSMLIPIGYADMNRVREEKYLLAKDKGYRFVSYVSSKATYYGSKIGENSIILENNVIQPYSEIGDNTILWSGNHIGHHAKIGSHCFVSSHVVVSGSAIIGNNSFLGVNSTIRDNINVGKRCLIGAGAVIMKDTEDETIYVPSRSVKLERDISI